MGKKKNRPIVSMADFERRYLTNRAKKAEAMIEAATERLVRRLVRILSKVL